MRNWRWYSKVLFALLVAAFAYFVWPTQWQYETVNPSLVRIHRITGRTEALRRTGWQPMELDLGEYANLGKGKKRTHGIDLSKLPNWGGRGR